MDLQYDMKYLVVSKLQLNVALPSIIVVTVKLF